MSHSVFVPAHITGFFCINDDINILKKGSLGAGFLMEDGVNTKIKKTNNTESKILFNGKEDSYNHSISDKILKDMIHDFDLSKSVVINHKLNLPIGFGFGTSASCALATALSLYKFFDLPISFEEACQYAHIAEVELGGGLGDVIAETSKGIVLRTKTGAPGFGKVKSFDKNDKSFFNNSEDLYVITKILSSIETSDVINSDYYKNLINSTGKDMVDYFIKNPSLNNFIDLSYKFAKKTNLLNEEVEKVINVLNEESIGSSMAMLGNTAFAISYEAETSLEDAKISKIDFNGIRFF